MNLIALRYATCTWNLKFAREQEYFLRRLSALIGKTVNSQEENGLLCDIEMKAVEGWKRMLYSSGRSGLISSGYVTALDRGSVVGFKQLSDRKQVAEKDAEFPKGQYGIQRILNGLPVLPTKFYIDPYTPLSRLAIQKHYDIRQEALHIGSSTMTAAELNVFRSQQKCRTYYTGSPLITNDLLPAAEIADLKAVGDEIYGTRTLFPPHIIEIAGIKRDGFPEENAERARLCGGLFQLLLRARDVEERFDLSSEPVERRALDWALWMDNDDCVVDTPPEDDMRQAEEVFNSYEPELDIQVQ
ncbi:hypothetical protein DL98DRAFT_530917 [Cadophora sp. DSE1049]|nr:hypothetical protein DL98DRAFT_530917 [Cadophora sp. DSE1049]